MYEIARMGILFKFVDDLISTVRTHVIIIELDITIGTAHHEILFWWSISRKKSTFVINVFFLVIFREMLLCVLENVFPIIATFRVECFSFKHLRAHFGELLIIGIFHALIFIKEFYKLVLKFIVENDLCVFSLKCEHAITVNKKTLHKEIFLSILYVI